MRTRACTVVLIGLVVACGVPSYNFDTPDAGTLPVADAAQDHHDAARDARHVQPDAKHHDAATTTCGACVEGAPSGWTGPIALFAGDESKAPVCDGDYSVVAYKGQGDLTSPTPTCGQCTCTPTGGSSCGASVSNAGTGCGDPVCGGFNLPAGACVSVASSGTSCVGSTVAYNTAGPSGSPIGCSASGGALTAPPATFGSVALGCASSLPSTGCASGESCGPAPPGPFNVGLCISQSGDVPCPGAYVYSVAHVFYGGSTDARACSACQCTAPTCDGIVDFFSSGSCTGVTGSSGLGAFCYIPGTSGSAMFVPSSTTCMASGGAASGTVTGTTPTTFCCTQ